MCRFFFFCFETSSLHPVPSLFTKEMLAWWWGSKWNLPPRECVCSCDGWFEGRDTTVLGQVCVCVCVPVSNGCSYAIWQAVFYGKSNLGDFVALPDQLNDLWASLIELDSSSQSRAHTPACYISAAYENLFRRAEMIAIHGHKVS